MLLQLNIYLTVLADDEESGGVSSCHQLTYVEVWVHVTPHTHQQKLVGSSVVGFTSCRRIMQTPQTHENLLRIPTNFLG